MKSSRTIPSLVLIAGALAVSWLYESPPILGDDLNYWGLALDLHTGVPNAWSDSSFHDLRWPVWGVCWLLQLPFGFTPLSYYLQPAVYLGAGAVLVFHLAETINLHRTAAWAAGILFVFHPLIDSVIGRPMPDLSEGFFVALSFLLWLYLVRSSHNGAKVILALLIGLTLATGQANRITGVFAVPVLLIVTLLYYRSQFPWLCLCGLFAGIFVGIEAAIYHSLTGDWLHSIHANLGARGRRGTEPIPFWELPFRFFPMLWRHRSDSIFNALGVAGIYFAFRRLDKPGKALACYAIIYFLTYSCALQSLNPLRPLVRDGERFLACLAYPMSILAAHALACLPGILPKSITQHRAFVSLERRPVASLALLTAFCALVGTRPIHRHNYLTDLAKHLDTIPENMMVTAHVAMRQVAYLANSTQASRVHWIIRGDLLQPEDETLRWVGRSAQIWFNRKWIWVSTRKRSEYKTIRGIGEIAPYLRPPMADWALDRAILKGDVPDFVFLTRRTPGSQLVEKLSDGRLVRDVLFPGLRVPAKWTFDGKGAEPTEHPLIPIPEELRGRKGLLSLRYASNKTEPFRASVRFMKGTEVLQLLTFKPYFFPESSEDFFFFEIPSEADTILLSTRMSPGTKRIDLDEFRVLIESASVQPDRAGGSLHAEDLQDP